MCFIVINQFIYLIKETKDPVVSDMTKDYFL